MNYVQTTLDRLRRPEYTGKNRCLPCTAFNTLIGLAAAVGVGPAAGAGAAAVVLLVSAASIYLRGYLVPGTPTFTKKYFPPWLLKLFGKSAARVRDATRDDEDDGLPVENTEQVLMRAGALEECRGGADFCLTDEFGAAWDEQIAEVRDSDAGRERLLDVLDVDEDVDVEYEEHDSAFEVHAEGYHVGTWESDAAYIADVAAGLLLAERLDNWERYSTMRRGQMLQGLRLFLETCPSCGSPVTFGTDTAESCCSAQEVAVVTCEGCGKRIFEAAVSEEQPPGASTTMM
ncbi:hypothetical protein [Halomicrobium urmianum]|uniref:hypothetical protein n=1 Tax=Halomicrobium urmianum TaxID=1586233 RepID=UPI001CD9ECA4|nr:hypothetical protein [Halomicrobium urmianum]